MGRRQETEHVLVQFHKGINRYVGGLYVCKCGNRYGQFHRWRDHRRDERRKRFSHAS